MFGLVISNTVVAGHAALSSFAWFVFGIYGGAPEPGSRTPSMVHGFS